MLFLFAHCLGSGPKNPDSCLGAIWAASQKPWEA